MTGTHAAARLCPRCKQALDQATLRDVPVAACKLCKGSLLAQTDLQRTLEVLCAPLLKRFDPDATLEAVKDRNARIDCPRCARQMDRDDYCGARLVFFDRCNHCALLWFDADELGAMAMMWARMNSRQAAYRNANPAGPSFLIIDRGLLGYSVWADLVFDAIGIASRFDPDDVW
jgi:Zn-finger nucleic acid-binding protein